MLNVTEPGNTVIATSTKRPTTSTPAIAVAFPADTNIVGMEHRDRTIKQ